MTAPLRIVIFGLTLSSSWGNGHATTYRALIRALADRGHEILFFEREQPWYADHRDLDQPSYCRLEFYRDLRSLDGLAARIEAADATIVGSYVPDGIQVGRFAQRHARLAVFYDIDTPVTLARVAREDCDYLSAALIPGYDLYLSFTGGPILTRLERDYGSPAARALYCSVDSDAYKPTAAHPAFDLGYLGTYSEDRQPALERFLIEPARRRPDLKFIVAGAQFPPHLAWPDNVARFEHVGPADHPKFYGASRFTLNVTRSDMIEAGYSPSVRLFEAAACGAPIVSDEWPGLDELFRPGAEIILAASADDVIAALDRPREEARRIGEAARRRILGAHTARHRALQLETYLAEAMAARHRRRVPAKPPHAAGLNQMQL